MKSAFCACAIVKPMSSALLNRMVHVHLRVSHREWLEWAYEAGIHRFVLEYIQNRPDHLWSQPPKHEEPFSSPRSWHMLSDALKECGEQVSEEYVRVLAFGCLSPHHAGQFQAFVKQIHSKYQLAAILKGEIRWPHQPEDRDVLYFLTQSLRGYLIKELPVNKESVKNSHRELAFQAKGLLKELANISLEMAQMVVIKDEEGQSLPDWFLVEVIRDLPRLVEKTGKKDGK